MSAVRSSMMALALLTACDGNPFIEPVPEPEDGSSVSTLPGSISSSGSVTRSEAKNEGPGGETVAGNGFAEGIHYDEASDTFTVDNLAFDGGNVYTRDTRVPTLGPANVYAASSTYADAQTGAVIDQFSYRALYGVSKTGKTSFAIVRTGAYVPYGFGGFVYSRNGSVTLPTSGQAIYTGEYAGIRDFDGQGGLQYTTGEMTVAVDFDAFKAEDSATGNGAAVYGSVQDRHVYNVNGLDITDQVVAQVNADLSPDVAITELPTLAFSVAPGAMDNNGEIQQGVNSVVDGQVYESGEYYAVIGGSDASEIVGVIVVTSPSDTVTVRETGGFILYQ